VRKIEVTTAFRRDFKRIKIQPRHRDINESLETILELLASDKPLPARNRDHTLTGAWLDHRECHIKPDLLLIYRKLDNDILQLVRIASHSELFSR
jgi:mRNA interferase YafQ